MARNGKGFWRGILLVVGVALCVGGCLVIAGCTSTTMSRAGTGGETSLGTYYQAAGMGELADDGVPIKNPEEAETEDVEPEEENERVYKMAWTTVDPDGYEYIEQIEIQELQVDNVSLRHSLIVTEIPPEHVEWAIYFRYRIEMVTTGYGEAQVPMYIGAARPKASYSPADWERLLTSNEDMIGWRDMWQKGGAAIGEEAYLTTIRYDESFKSVRADDSGIFDLLVVSDEHTINQQQGFVVFVDETRKTPNSPYGVTPEMFSGWQEHEGTIRPFVFYAGAFLRSDREIPDGGSFAGVTPIVSIEMNEEGEVALGDGIGTIFAEMFK